MRSTRGAAIAVAVVGAGFLAVAVAADAPAASSIRPAAGAPDPKQMVLRSADLGGARVTAQRYYKDADFPSVISCEREFEGGGLGSNALPHVYNEAEVGTSVLPTTRFLASLRRLFGTKQFRTFLTQSFAEEFPIGGIASNFQIGRPRNLGAGAGSFDVPISVRILGLRTEMHIAAFRVERVLGGMTAVGEPGRRLPLSVVTRLAKTLAARMSVEVAPRSTALPTISGIPVVGKTLTATTGAWSRNPTSFAYQWRRCDPSGAICASIAGSAGQSYVVADADTGSTLRVSVTARNAAGAAMVASAPTGAVSAAGAPTNTSVPTISGTAQVGQTLTAGTGTRAGSPTSFGFQWQRCSASGMSCVDIAGAASGTYVLVAPDAGATIRVIVTATNAVGAASAASAPTPCRRLVALPAFTCGGRLEAHVSRADRALRWTSRTRF